MESRARSVAKGITWRVLATTDTVLLAFIFTGSFSTALSIGGWELITKVFWYYAHERLWLYIPTEHNEYPRLERWLGHGKQVRSMLKAASWRFLGAIDTFLISFVITGQFTVSGSIGGTELITKIILYYLHDRMWDHVAWGRIVPNQSVNVAPPILKEGVVRRIFRNHYGIGAVEFYAGACVTFVIVSTSFVYVLHSLFPGVPQDEFTELVEVD